MDTRSVIKENYQDQCSAELYIDRGLGAEEENKAAFDQLREHQLEVEEAFGGPLSWERLDGETSLPELWLNMDTGNETRLGGAFGNGWS